MFPERLINGYQDFFNGRLESERKLYQQLGKFGQSPEIMVIGCGDSRVAPEVIFNADPGELFVIRNIANLVPPNENDSIETAYHGTSAAIEFATNALKVKHIVVLGHAGCGGVAAFAHKAKPLSQRDFIGKWMSQIAPVTAHMPPMPSEDQVVKLAEWIRNLELAVVEYSLNNLMTFPSVQAQVAKGELQLHGAYFGIVTGQLFLRDPQSGVFKACSNT